MTNIEVSVLYTIIQLEEDVHHLPLLKANHNYESELTFRKIKVCLL